MNLIRNEIRVYGTDFLFHSLVYNSLRPRRHEQ